MSRIETITIHKQPETVIYMIGLPEMEEIMEEEGLEGDAARRAAEEVLSAAEEIDLNALARFVFEQTGVEVADFEDEE